MDVIKKNGRIVQKTDILFFVHCHTISAMLYCASDKTAMRVFYILKFFPLAVQLHLSKTGDSDDKNIIPHKKPFLKI